jgi:superfamily II DNA or RNA helicase
LPKTRTLLIGDEVHNLGSAASIDALVRLDFSARLGLSATPRRWSDDETDAIFDYFGQVAYEFSLNRAIREGYLVPYTYHPHLVDLNDEEMTEYIDVSRRLARLGPAATAAREVEDVRGYLLRKRSAVLNNAAGKLVALPHSLAGGVRRYTLVYTTPERLEETVGVVSQDGRSMVHRFTYRESLKERQRLLTLFARGEIGTLVAIRCLDEGVDIPRTEVAHILASSSSSREFIQRRGRILRRAEGKRHAAIHDYLAIPSTAFADEGAWKFERQIVRREIGRFREFAATAENRLSAEEELVPLVRRYALFDI